MKKFILLNTTALILLTCLSSCHQRSPEVLADLQSDSNTVSPRFNHIFLAVTDLEESINFYTRAFDVEVTNRLKKLKRTGPDGTTSETEVNMAFLKFPGQNFVFELGERPDYTANNAAPSYAHVGIDVTDIETASARLQAAGAKLMSPIVLVEAEGVAAKNAFFSGPDGETLELMQLISGEF